VACVASAAAVISALPAPSLAAERNGSLNNNETIERLLYGETSVKTARLSVERTLGRKTGSATGVYNFVTATGELNQKPAGGGPWVMLIKGSTMYWPTAEFKQISGLNYKGNPAVKGPPPPVIDKPWVSRTFGNGRGSAVGDLLAPTFSVAFLLPSPKALVQDLQRRLLSESVVRGGLGGTAVTEYHLVLDGQGIINAQFPQPFGPSHPMFIWVDRVGRLLRLSTTVPGPPKETLTEAFSGFNERVVVHFPPPGAVESWAQIWAEWQRTTNHH